MKNNIFILLITTLLFSCNNSKKNQDSNNIQVNTKTYENSETQVEETAPIVKLETGEFFEKYPNGNLKTEGWNNAQGERDGVWYSYYETGVKWSESAYKNGLKDGHSIVFYPNGKMRYMGDYKNDKKTGHWTFYNETGEITKEEDY